MTFDGFDPPSDHFLGKRLGSLFRRIAFIHPLAAAQNRGSITQRADLFKLMADVEDGPALAREFAQRREEDLGFLGCQDRSRFIQNQQAGVLQQTANDLDTLALPHGEVIDMPVRV